MDVIVGFLVGWAVQRAQRAGQRITEHTDQAVDALVDRVWAILAAKLGMNPWLDRLRTEAAQTGAVSAEVRSQAQRVLQAAADHDHRFAHDLRVAVQAAVNHTAGHAAPPTHNTGNYIGTIVAGGKVSIRQKIVTLARRRPLPFAAATLVLVGLIAWGGYGVVTAISSGTTTSSTAIDQSTPEATAKGYVAALNDHDRSRAGAYVCADLQEELVNRRSRTVDQGVISEHGVVVHATITVKFYEIGTYESTPIAHMALVVTNIPDDTPPEIKQSISKPDDFNEPLQKAADGKWYICKAPAGQ